MYTSEVVDLLRKLYEWSMVDPRDIDDEKYLFAKKFSEVLPPLEISLLCADSCPDDVKSWCVHRIQDLSYTGEL
jgi:hypothetical protein